MFVSTQGSYKLGHINNPFLYYLLLLYAYICVFNSGVGGGREIQFQIQNHRGEKNQIQYKSSQISVKVSGQKH